MTSKKFTLGSPGDTVYFFSRARDEAGNVEGWHTPEWDTRTKLYTWQLSGTVSDNRGNPLPETLVNILPAPAAPAEHEAGGKYHAWLLTQGALAVDAQSSGYAAFPPANLSVDMDEVRSLYLPPQDDLIQNGGFEGQNLSGWTISGSATLTDTLEAAHTGTGGLFLGVACTPPCLGEPETVAAMSANSWAIWHRIKKEISMPSTRYSQPRCRFTTPGDRQREVGVLLSRSAAPRLLAHLIVRYP